MNQTEHKAFVFGRKPFPLSSSGVALEHRAALMGIAVQPLARSDSAKENMKSVVRSSRSCGYLAMTAITILFSITFITTIALMIIGSALSVSPISMFIQSPVNRFLGHLLR